MNEDNLIPLKKAGDPRSDKVRAKAKGSSSPRRVFAQKLSALKSGRVKESNIDAKMLALVTDPQASALQLQELTQMLIERGISDADIGEFNQVVNTTKNVHSAIHGTAVKVHSTITNFDRMRDAIADAKEKEESGDIVVGVDKDGERIWGKKK